MAISSWAKAFNLPASAGGCCRSEPRSVLPVRSGGSGSGADQSGVKHQGQRDNRDGNEGEEVSCQLTLKRMAVTPINVTALTNTSGRACAIMRSNSSAIVDDAGHELAVCLSSYSAGRGAGAADKPACASPRPHPSRQYVPEKSAQTA